MKNEKIKIKRQKAKIKRDNFLNEFINIVKENKNHLPKFNKRKNYPTESINTNSWFDITKITSKTKRNPVVVSVDKLDKVEYKQIKVKMILSDIHKQIFQNWFNTTTLIYNETLKYIHQNYKFTRKEIKKDILLQKLKISSDFCNKRKIRNKLNELKKQIQQDTIIIIDKIHTKSKINNLKCVIDIHTLDKTIFQLVQNIQSAVTNMLHGNIKDLVK